MVVKNKRQILIGFSALTLIIIVLVISFTNYISQLTKTLESEVETYLEEISQQSVLSLRNNIESEVILLNNLAKILGKEGSLNVEKSLEILGYVSKNESVKRMGIILNNGEVYTTDGIKTNASVAKVFKNAMISKPVISDIYEDEIDANKVNMSSAPIYNNEKIIGYIFSIHELESYQKILEVSTFGGKGYSYIIKSNGQTVSHSSHISSIKNFNFNIKVEKSIHWKNEKDKKLMFENMEKGKSGVFKYSINGLDKYMNYTPIGINDWYLLSVVPSDVVANKIDYIKFTTIAIGTAGIAFIGILMIFIIFTIKKDKEELYKIAFLDGITGISNFKKFSIDCENILKKNYNKKYAVIYFDINKFNYINDRIGYNSGNTVLDYVSKTFKDSLKKGETICRVSADKFIAMLNYEDIPGDEERIVLVKRVERIFESISSYTDSLGRSIEMSFSVGIYLVQEDARKKYFNMNAVIDKADFARKNSKGNHDTTFTFYNKAHASKIIREKELEEDMSKALKNEEFIIYFQPKYNLYNLKVGGAEALVRWFHPEKGHISPGEFIPLFEKNGFIKKLDLYVFEKVCQIIEQWIKEGREIVPISVNVSRANIKTKGFLDSYKEILEKYQIPMEYLEIEITESAVINNVIDLVYIIKDIKDFGFTISMDDFGSGYSSLSLLKNIPVDILKLDREFFSEVNEDGRWKKVILGVVALAKSMNLKIVSEGVETKEQAEFLSEINCDMAQGYYFAKPMPCREFETLLDDDIN